MPLRMILRSPVVACRAGNRATNLVAPRIATQAADTAWFIGAAFQWVFAV